VRRGVELVDDQKKTQVREINAKWSWITNENQIRTSEGGGNGHKTKTDSVGFEPTPSGC
jgi:hypothetical protein